MGTPVSAQEWLVLSHEQFASRDLLAARASAEMALGLVGPNDPPRKLGQVRFHLGMVTRELGDTTTALTQFNAFLDEAPTKYPDLADAAPKALFYRALTHRQAGNYADAVQDNKRAATGFSAMGDTANYTKAGENLVWALCLMGDVAEAKRYHTGDTIHARLNAAFIALLEGDPVGCSIIAADIRPIVKDVEVQAQADWLMAKAYAATGDTAQAQSFADAAAVAATQYGDTRLVQDAANAQRQLRMGA